MLFRSHAALHGSLTVASIYEEINDLHEETVDIVLAHNWEVKRQLVALKKDISLHCVIHTKQVALVHAAASHPGPSGLFSAPTCCTQIICHGIDDEASQP